MSKTFTELKTSIGQWLGIDLEDDATRLPDAVRGDIINICMRDYLRRRESRFSEFSDTFATIASPVTPTYAVPTGWSRPKSLWYASPDDSTNIIFLTLRDKDEFDSLYPDSTQTADPESYTVWQEKIYLGKSPKRVLTIHRNYWRLLADLADVTPNNENIFTQQAWEYLLFASLVMATEFGVEDARAPIWERERAKIEVALDLEDTRRVQTGRTPQSREPG